LPVVSFVSNAYPYRMQRRVRRLLRTLHRRFRPMTPTPTAIREYDTQAPASEMTETATFGVGCFWGPDAQFGALDGVVCTRVGYAGGTKTDPTYHSLGDQTEVFQLDFDPDVISYSDLLARLPEPDPHSQTRKRSIKTSYSHKRLLNRTRLKRSCRHGTCPETGLTLGSNSSRSSTSPKSIIKSTRSGRNAFS